MKTCSMNEFQRVALASVEVASIDSCFDLCVGASTHLPLCVLTNGRNSRLQYTQFLNSCCFSFAVTCRKCDDASRSFYMQNQLRRKPVQFFKKICKLRR